jgi:small subunit ribosomal protein S4e
MGIGIFDIIALPKINKYYRILRDKNGRHVSILIDAEAAKTRLCKVTNKTTITGGKVQLNMRDGSNLLADNTYKPGDSIILSLEPENRFKIIGHFPFAVGNMAMVIGGKHSGKVARIKDIVKVPGSVPNKIILTDETTGTTFDTIAPYIYMVGTTAPAIAKWGHEE